jgi:hypothetical protein
VNFTYLLSNAGRTNYAYTTLNQALGANTAFLVDGIGVAPRQSLSAVLNVPMAAVVPGWRDKDAFGMGYSFVDLHEGGLGRGFDINNSTALASLINNAPARNGNVPNNRLIGSRASDGFEHVAEFFYRFQLNDSVSVVPSFQLIFNRLGLEQNGVTSIIGLRTNYTF